ncbi:protein HESO1-like [Phragmites australis]|uniref:protein HESO1-like n=1 Tax=Phragmites australis TaxID=29695 RepID=UPI002D79F14C|nr:protein HESO1-like [Phragmites australis]XP_062225898.1 protein HESO1-like [Phragmites australis]
MIDFVHDYVVLEKCVKDILTLIKPAEDDRKKRLSAILELENCMNFVQSLRGVAVKPFGSFVSDLYSKSGDLDLSVQLWNDSNVPTNKKKKQNVLKEVRRALLTRGVAGYMQFIPHARVPVLQYVSNRFGISCDISVDNYAGRIKSKIFYWVNTLDERFGDMVLLIKEWAKAQNINDPKSGSLNSYSLCLLVLFHFQTSVPPIVPPLKEIYEGNIAEDITEVALYNEEQLDEVCAANIARFRLQNKGQRNESSLCHLLATFFHKFIHISAFPDDVISTYTGQFERTQDNPSRMTKSYNLFVEDPIERPDNAARAVSMKGLNQIACAFNDAYRKFDSLEHIDRNELLALLCTPGVGSKLGGRVIANSYTTTPQKSHQLTRSIGRGERDQRLQEARGSTGSRQVNKNPQANTTVHQTAVQHQNRNCPQGYTTVRQTAGSSQNTTVHHKKPQPNTTVHQTAVQSQNRNCPQGYTTVRQTAGSSQNTTVHHKKPQPNTTVHQTAVQSQNRNCPQVYTTVRQTAGSSQNRHHPQAYIAGNQTAPYLNYYHPQVYPALLQTAGPYQNHDQQVYTTEFQTAGPYQNHNQQVYTSGFQAAGPFQNQQRRKEYMSNRRTNRRAATASYEPVRGQFYNGSTWDSRSQASNSAASQR